MLVTSIKYVPGNKRQIKLDKSCITKSAVVIDHVI